MILHSLVDEELPKHVYRSVRSERRFLSRSSLVCRKWLSIQRPKLFEDLTIRNSAELRFLLNVLRQQRDGRLASEVIYLHIMCQDVSLPLDRICRLLTGKLPAVRHIDLALQKYQSVSAQSLRLFCTSQASLRRLEIYRVGFISFSAFFHALQDMASVEELSLRYNTWGGVEERPPTRISLAGFPNLRFVDVDGKPIHCRMSAFLFAPALARRCEVIPGRVNAHNSDSSLLSMIVKSCCPEKSDEGVGLTYDKGMAHTFIILSTDISCTLIIANDKISFHSFAKTVDVDLWPTASLAENGKWSVIRSIRWVGFAKPEIDEIDWESLDKVILTDATRLLEIRIGLISDDYWDTFSIRLPELTKLEKVTLEVGGRELHTVSVKKSLELA